jgi:hypothetical protein
MNPYALRLSGPAWMTPLDGEGIEARRLGNNEIVGPVPARLSR